MHVKEKIDAGKFVVLGEFDPPKGPDFSRFLENVNRVKGRVDALVVPEMANAVMKASSLGGCAFLQAHGIDTILQACCRDRNRLALQADILAASALGISSMMVVPGEDIRYGDHPQAREVYDVDVMQLLDIIDAFQAGKDMAGIALEGRSDFFLGATINAGAMGGALDIALESLDRMVEKGIRFVVTTPVFDLHRFQQFTKRIDTEKVAVIPTVLLLKSAGMARYIDRNINHISIPTQLIRDIQKAPDKVKQCMHTAAELITGLREMGMPGVMISTVGWEAKLPQLLDAAKL
ncbi:MAG: methylenetetrahydrofolate reductase [Desulfatiglandaceae bacterium]